jgi:glycosyltransferase involved in cell wall biosynthesis
VTEARPVPAHSAARPIRLAVVVSHPIQHFVSFYRAIAATPGVDLRVIFGSRLGLKAYFDREMNTTLSWKMDLLSGYPHLFLPKADEATESGRSLNDPALGPALDEFAPDAVLIYGYRHVNSLRALAWCRANRVPAIMIGDSEGKQKRAFWKEAGKRLVLPLLFRQFRAFLTVGDENELYYRRYGVPRDRLFRSPFTIDEESFRAAIGDREAARLRVRKAYGLPDDAFLALFVGKLSDRKRPADLLAAVKSLGGQSPVHAIFAGAGPLLEELQGQASESPNCRLLGFINLDELPSLFVASDVLVHPSSADPHPLVCSEAAISGLPMILSDRIGAVGPTDVARPGENALVYPCGNVEALATRLRTVSSDLQLHRRMAAESSRIFSEVDLHSSIDGLLRALAAVTGRIAEPEVITPPETASTVQDPADEAA